MNENESHEQKNFDGKAKKFFKDKKNVAIVILSMLVVIYAGALGNANNATNTISTSTNVALEETTQESNDESVNDLTDQLNEANEKISTLENDNAELTKKNRELVDKINAMPNAEELQSQLEQKDNDILTLQAQVGVLTAEKAKLESENGILQQQLSAKNTVSSSTTSSSTSSSNNSQSTSSSTSTSYTVYVTNTGSKYHRSGCSYLRQSSHAIDKNSAISQGYTACSRCNP